MHDVTQAEALLKGVHTLAVVADKAYDADPLIETITTRAPAPSSRHGKTGGYNGPSTGITTNIATSSSASFVG